MPKLSYPEVVVFDLDYTLWPWWCDCHISSPIEQVSESQLLDSSGLSLSLYRDVEHILEELEANNVTIVGASRTATPDIAIEILSMFKINDKPMIDYFHSLQWGQNSKIGHIKRAMRELNMESTLSTGSIILFDDEDRNKDVESINCFFALIEDYEKGLTRALFEQKLKDWASRR